MKRVMLDIETLSTFPNAAVIAFAAVVRDDSNPKHPQARAWFIDQDFVIGHQDSATLEWWASQRKEVRSVVFGGNQIPREAFQELNGFLASNGVNPLVYEQDSDAYRIYASPAMFDLPIMRHQYQQLGLAPAWHWRAERCLSTLKKEIRDNFSIEIADVEPELQHHPTHDCLAQFEELDLCLQTMRNATWGRG